MLNFYKEWRMPDNDILEKLTIEEDRLIFQNINDDLEIEINRGDIVINGKHSELVRFMDDLESFFNEFIQLREPILIKIENLRIGKEDKIDDKDFENLIENQKEAIQLAKEIYDWLESFKKEGLKLCSNDIPFEEFTNFFKKFSGKKVRDPIKIEIKI